LSISWGHEIRRCGSWEFFKNYLIQLYCRTCSFCQFRGDTKLSDVGCWSFLKLLHSALLEDLFFLSISWGHEIKRCGLLELFKNYLIQLYWRICTFCQFRVDTKLGVVSSWSFLKLLHSALLEDLFFLSISFGHEIRRCELLELFKTFTFSFAVGFVLFVKFVWKQN
jgi:hypothetical protein